MSDDPKDDSMLRDEQGARSAMRHLLFLIAIPMLVAMTLIEATRVHEFQQVVWTVWSSVTTFLVVGCFGPRIAQYLAPQIGTALTSVAQAIRTRRSAEKGVEPSP